MKKMDKIKEIVKKWVQSGSTQTIKEKRFINHDRVENEFNYRWTKEMIEIIYNRIFSQNEDINYIVAYYTFAKFIY